MWVKVASLSGVENDIRLSDGAAQRSPLLTHLVVLEVAFLKLHGALPAN
jgi:hypothetical protein